MARGSRTRRNVPPSTVSPSEPEQPASPEEGTLAPSDVGPPDAAAPAAPVSAPASARYTEEDLQRITKLCMDSLFQAQASRPESSPWGSSLKARFSDLYHGKSYMECYNFCQQCEDHFATAGATRPNRTPFAAFFLCGRISFRWNQHKLQHQATKDPLFWGEFKAFLRKSLGDSRSFVDVIWNKIRWDCQYQQEEIQDWASHLEYLQSILMEFNAGGAPGESTLIQIFRNGLKPSIATQIEQRGRENDSWEELVEKTIEAEAKVSFLPSPFVRDMDQRCPQGNRPATMSKSQAFSTRDPRDELSLNKALASNKLPHSSRSKNGDTSDKKAWKEKKKKQRRRDVEQAGKDPTPATGVNASGTKTHPWRKNSSLITCYNCNKKGHYVDHCSEPKKNASKN